jgi:hypothetical protein
MAGYIIYSLDWGKFQGFVERPTPGQLAAFASLLCDGLEEYEFDEGDPLRAWPTKAKALAPIAAGRLALPDWYGDLSATGKAVWEGAIFGACMEGGGIDLGFRADNDGVYWDVMELAWKQLGVVPGQISDVALSAFGCRPYRYHPETEPAKTRKDYEKEEAGRRSALKELKGEVDEFLEELGATEPPSKADPQKMLEEVQQGTSGDIMKALMGFFDDVAEGGGGGTLEEWEPMHSMHTPDEVRQMLAELRSVESTMLKARKKDVRRQYEEDLLPALNSVADDQRMLFIQVDT